jgi:transposase
MKLHANARTCPKSRRLLVERVAAGWSLAEAAAAAGVSDRSAAKWLARWRAEGPAGLVDRSSAPKRVPHRTPELRVEAIVALRRLRMTAAEIAELLSMALSTVSAVLRRVGLGKLSRLDRPEPANRYEHVRPGGLLHVDVKKLGRILSPGHRVVGHRRSQKKVGPKRLGAAGWEFVHVCVDDATRLAYAEVLADERGDSAAAFLARAVAWFQSMASNPNGCSATTAPATARESTPPPAASSVCATASRAPTGPGQTARRSDSSRRSPTAGPTERSTRPRSNAQARYPAG